MRSGGKCASPGDIFLLFHIVKVVALVLFRSQDVAPPFNKPRLIGKLSLQRYRQLHVLSLDWNIYLLASSLSAYDKDASISWLPSCFGAFLRSRVVSSCTSPCLLLLNIMVRVNSNIASILWLPVWRVKTLAKLMMWFHWFVMGK